MPEMRSFRVGFVVVALVSLMAACSNGKEQDSFRGFESTAEAPTPVAESTTTAPLSMAALVLSADGLGPIPFGTQAAQALGAVTQALGRAEDSTVVPAEANCEATRIFKWKDLDVLVNEVGSRSDGRAGLVGWSMRGAPSSLDLKTDRGVGIGSTVAALRAAYGEGVTTAQSEGGSTVEDVPIVVGFR